MASVRTENTPGKRSPGLVGRDSRNQDKMMSTMEDTTSVQNPSGLLRNVASVQDSIQEQEKEEEEKSRAGSERIPEEEDVKSRSTDRERVRKTIKTSSSKKSEEKEDPDGTKKID